MHKQIHVRACSQTQTRTYTHAHTQTHIHTRTHASKQASKHTHTRTHIHTHIMYVGLRGFLSVCICVLSDDGNTNFVVCVMRPVDGNDDKKKRRTKKSFRSLILPNGLSPCTAK